MKMVHAIYEGGVFRPTEAVELPDHSQVEFVPRLIVSEQSTDQLEPSAEDSKFSHLDPKLAKIYAVLSRRHESGQSDIAERHDEHQP